MRTLRGDHRDDQNAAWPAAAHAELQSVGTALDTIDALAEAQAFEVVALGDPCGSQRENLRG